jgi:hypothetical protein
MNPASTAAAPTPPAAYLLPRPARGDPPVRLSDRRSLHTLPIGIHPARMASTLIVRYGGSDQLQSKVRVAPYVTDKVAEVPGCERRRHPPGVQGPKATRHS